MFRGANAFHEPIGAWNVERITDMNHMFGIMPSTRGKWTVSQTCMPCFTVLTGLIRLLDSWNVERVTDMGDMFPGAYDFNQPLASRNVSRVTSFRGMSWDASSFNQPLDSWDVGNSVEVSAMFPLPLLKISVHGDQN